MFKSSGSTACQNTGCFQKLDRWLSLHVVLFRIWAWIISTRRSFRNQGLDHRYTPLFQKLELGSSLHAALSETRAWIIATAALSETRAWIIATRRSCASMRPRHTVRPVHKKGHATFVGGQTSD